MGGIMRLGFIENQVVDLAKTSHFYEKLLGLEKTAETKDALYFKCWDEYDHHSLVLRKGAGPGMLRIGWKVERDADLDEAERRMATFGVTVKRVSKGEEPWIGEALSFESPSGHRMLMYREIEQVGKAVKVPDMTPRNSQGIAPPHLDHLFVSGEDPGLNARFLCEALDFRVSEECVDEKGTPLVSFLARTNTPHDIAVSRGPQGKYHHIAYYIDSWDDVRRAAQILADNDWSVEVPPSHHGGTRGQTTYFKDPSGNRLETFAGGYMTYPDFPTVTWRADQLPRMLFYFGGPADLQAWQAPI